MKALREYDTQDSMKRFRVYAILVAVLFAVYHLIELKYFNFLLEFIPFIKRLVTSFIAIIVVLFLEKVVGRIIARQSLVEGDRYNLFRITRLISLSLVGLILVSFLFQKPYTSLASLGLISLVLSFSLQAPITSFIGWLYIVLRQPYKVGSRIQIDQYRGDVVEINYLDTIMLEVSGDYLGNDRLSGRKVHFPNSLILKDKVINYSGPQIPFIWNETQIQIAYTSDLAFVEKCLMDATIEDFKTRYPVMYEEESERWRPAVYFRVNEFAWMEAVVSYPVEPADTTGRRNRILRYALPALNAEPDKVQFPEGTHR